MGAYVGSIRLIPRINEAILMDPELGMLEELLGITEQFLDDMAYEDRNVWLRISADVADLREVYGD
jgi:hypothetical protein